MNDSIVIPLKRCSKCGIEKPATAEYWYPRKDSPNVCWRNPCKVCINMRDKSYRDNNPEREAARHRHYISNHRERVNATNRSWRQNNPERARARDRQYRESNPERRKEIAKKSYYKHWATNQERSRRWQNEHPEYKRQLRRESQKRHPESMRARGARRRARILNALGTHTAIDIALQLKAQTDKKGIARCWWCGKPLGDDQSLDHRIPLSRGGSNDAGNLCICHLGCNKSKNAKLPWEWNGRLL